MITKSATQSESPTSPDELLHIQGCSLFFYQTRFRQTMIFVQFFNELIQSTLQNNSIQREIPSAAAFTQYIVLINHKARNYLSDLGP